MERCCAALLSVFCLAAAAEPASEASVERLMAVTKAEEMLTSLQAGVEQLMRQGIRQAVAGRTLTPEQERVVEAAPAKLAAVMREELAWSKLKPMYLQVYRETFDQQEVDGLLVFYGSPLGQALLAKMPTVVQRSMAISQGQMQAVIPRMRQVMDEVLRDAKVKP